MVPGYGAESISLPYADYILERGTTMAAQKKGMGNKASRRMRRRRLYGLTDSILSNATAYLNPYVEGSSPLSPEEAALYAAVVKYFNENNS